MGTQQALGARTEKGWNPWRKFDKTLLQAKRELCLPIYIGLICTIITETSTILRGLSGEK